MSGKSPGVIGGDLGVFDVTESVVVYGFLKRQTGTDPAGPGKGCPQRQTGDRKDMIRQFQMELRHE